MTTSAAAAATIKWQNANPEKVREYKRKHREANRDKYAADKRKWRKDNPEKARESNLKHKYGITLAQYNDKLASQGFKCAICSTETAGGTGLNFHVDHCHETSVVRGLLCFDCNVGIGKLRHDPAVLERAASYLKDYKA